MSEPIFERYVDERGNISVRVSQDVTVLTQEEAERAMAKYDQLRTENQRLRELCADMLSEDMDQHWPEFTRRALELGVEVDA